jgi:SAM-dependent methyltransferase
VLFFDVLEHLKNDDMILKEINRILEDDGTLIISVPHKYQHPIRILDLLLNIKEKEYDLIDLKLKLTRSGFVIESHFIGGGLRSLIAKYLFVVRNFFLVILKLFRFDHTKRGKVATYIRRKLTHFADKEFDKCKEKGTSIIIKARKGASEIEFCARYSAEV